MTKQTETAAPTDEVVVVKPPDDWMIECADWIVRGQVTGIATTMSAADCIQLMTMPIARIIAQFASSAVAPTADHLPDDEKVAREIVGPFVSGSILLPVGHERLTHRIASALQSAREPVAEQWRPIESAPKGEKYILGGWWYNSQMWWWGRCEYDAGWFCREGGTPTHWMPLPAGPQENQEGGDG